MNNIRDKFEAWAKPYYKEQQMSLNSAEHFARPNEYMMPHYQSAYEGWQAATEQSQKEIAELEAQRNHWQNMAGKFANDEFIALGKLTQASLEIEELQAREKELVEALQNLVEDISKTHGNYTYEQAWINADEALANVRGEVK